MWHLPIAGMARAAGLPNHYFDELVEFSQPGSRYWEYRCRREAHDAIAIPILHFCGWYDNYLGQQLRDWKRYRRLDRSGGRNFLMIGPWSHEGPSGPAERVGIVPVAEDGTHRWDRMQRFYDRYLMGIENGFEAEPLVSYFVIGRGRVARRRHLAAAGRRDADLVPARAGRRRGGREPLDRRARRRGAGQLRLRPGRPRGLDGRARTRGRSA